MKIVINTCYGGFSLSRDAVMRYAEIKGITLYPEKGDLYDTYYTVPKEERQPRLSVRQWDTLTDEQRIAHNKRYYEETFWPGDIARDDPALVQVVEEMGDKASGRLAALHVVEIPDDVQWEIAKYYGLEHVAEKHRTWG